MQFNDQTNGLDRNILYKGNYNFFNFSKDRVNNSRVRQKENRAKNFIENRFLSPTPKKIKSISDKQKTPKRDLTIPVGTKLDDGNEKEKKNYEENNFSLVLVNKTSKKSKMERQQLFMARFKAWKKEKAVKKVQEHINKLKPFVAAAWPSAQSALSSLKILPVRKDLKIEGKNNVINVPKTQKNVKKNVNSVAKSHNAIEQKIISAKTSVTKQFKKPAIATKPLPSAQVTTVSTAANSKQATIIKPIIPRLKPLPQTVSSKNKKEKFTFLKPLENQVNTGEFITPIEVNEKKSLVSSLFVTSTHRKNSGPDVIVPDDFGLSFFSPIDNENSNEKTIVNRIENESNLNNLEPALHCVENLNPLVIVEKKIDFILKKRKSRKQENNEIDGTSNCKTPKTTGFKNKTPSSATNKQIRWSTRKSDELLIDLNKTPVQIVKKDNPMNYMSPNVVVSRGKVNKNEELEKRNSIYLCDPTTPDSISPEDLNKKRTKASISYFRIQFKEESSKLVALCDEWEKYITHLSPELLENAGPMINAAIGVTNQLLSKKLKKFESLIDRCEETITTKKFDNINIADLNDSGKPVIQEDLEGFWALIQQQIDDLQKRFDNLNRWKFNNWNDPDDIPISQVVRKERTKNNIIKNKKCSTNASSKLRETIKKMYAEKKKNEKGGLSEISDILTPSKRKGNKENEHIFNAEKNDEVEKQTPVRRSGRISQILAAVRRNSTPRSSKSLLKLKNNKSNKSITPTMNQITTPISRISNRKDLKKSKSPQNIPQKSILKTPGTASKNRNVLFKDSIEEFKSPDVIYTPEVQYSTSRRKIIRRQSTEDDSKQTTRRALHLRNHRIIIMDTNAQIEIPVAKKEKK